MENKKAHKKPVIRFKGFTEDWEVDTFKNLTVINQGLQIAISNRFTRPIKGGYFYITNEFLKEGSKSKYYILAPTESVICTENDVLMTRTGNTGEVVTNVKGAFHNNFFKIKFNPKQIDKDFLVYFLKLDATQLLIRQLAGNSTIPDLNHNDFYRIELPFPKPTEQKKIGSFFQNMDTLITLHQKKYDKLMVLKKAMLGKLFPKKGSLIPEIRFKGFSGDWVEKEINALANRFDNLRIPITANQRIKGKTPYYGANGIQDYVQGHTHEGEFILVAEDGANDLKNYPVQYVKGKIWVNNHAHVLQAKKTIADNKFLKRAISNTNIEPFLVGGGRAKLNAETMMKIEIHIPINIKEQEQIGSYFESLDNQIALHKTQLTKLNNLKKACFSKLFVAQN